jgi:hypothetical protein
LRKLWLFEPWHNRAPFLGHYYSWALSKGIAPIQIGISPTSHLRLRCSWVFYNPGALFYSKLMALPSWLFSFCRWEAFPMLRVLIHARITWRFSPMAPQVPGVTLRFPSCPWWFGHSSWRGAQQWWTLWSHVGWICIVYPIKQCREVD